MIVRFNRIVCVCLCLFVCVLFLMQFLHSFQAHILETIEVADIREINLVSDKETKVHKGFAFVELMNAEASIRLLGLNESILLGSTLAIRPAREKSIKLQGDKDNYRRFGSLDYSALALQVDKRHKTLVAEQIARNEKSREEYLQKKELKELSEKAFVEAGGQLPGGYGHGYAQGKPKLHKGYSHFEM
jgi:RNA recognition motif-containing protein